MTGQPALMETATLEEDNCDAPHTKARRSLFGSVMKHMLSDSEMSALGDQMIQNLSEDEKEHAARSSYKYLWKSVTSSKSEKESKEFKEEQSKMAKSMAMRFIQSKKGNYAVAMQKFKSAIAFRKQMDLDGLRLCFQADKLDLDDATREKYAMYRERLSERMTTGRVYVCGYDKQGRAIYTIYAARTKDFDPEWFLKESLFNFEKALACTERESGGVKDSITVIGNYTGFQSKHSAPMSISHRFMDSLRQNYPGRVHRVYLLRTPTSFMVFWSLLKPFIGTDTRKKIIFLSERHRQEQFADLVDQSQAAPWMLDGGSKTKEFDSNEYLNDIPFDECFDS
ncbi:CRAL-TRIO domain containing protein [Nitzschia inconspicua]|uniref:CRAL-TRIO domain containing protein n=1 Tax=Nitzschia inconspicua TaxID=303405 RepID=A0A9K3L526_9STRA|nr:CRAL-TRIO domain containing protein [Nitzschia inconspicua]